MYSLQVVIHVRPQGLEFGPSLRLSGRQVTTLKVLSTQLSLPFLVSFETACERLEKLPRMFCEPDGSFVWVANEVARNWQLDGNLVDGPAGLMYVELAGKCPPSAFDQLLSCLGWPETPLVFQLVREAVFLDEVEMRRLGEARI